MTRASRAANAVAAVVAFASVAAHGAPSATDDAANARVIALANPGFEAPPAQDGRPPGWVAMQHAGVPAYTFGVDRAVRHSGAQSLRIARVGDEPFGSIVQSVADPSLRGRSVRFSAWLRTEGAATREGPAGGALIVQAMRAGTPVAYDHMRAAPVKGSTDWRRYVVTIAVPADADSVEVGAMLVGTGTVWLDDAKLEVAGR